MKTLLLLALALSPLLLAATSHAQAPAGMSKVEADAYNAAYAAEMARQAGLKAVRELDPLAAPVPPGKDAGPHEWANYHNAVAAWNQRTAAAAQQKQATAAQERQAFDAAVARRIREQRAAEQKRQEEAQAAAYQRWLQERHVQALEALARKTK